MIKLVSGLWYPSGYNSQQIAFRQDPVGGQWDFVLQVVQSWESKCRASHSTCTAKQHASHDRLLPSRLIDLRLGRNKGELPRLVISEDLTSKDTKYMTLSHRWAEPELMSSTTKSNVQDRMSKIEDLPTTYQQAMTITKMLGVPYIWIDSLCIIQDDDEDKGREIIKMAAVYSNSHCNIAASNATSPTQGCYSPANIIHLVPHTLIIPGKDGVSSTMVLIKPGDRTDEELSIGLESGTLSERGWVVQERYLPTRTIVFTPTHLIWLCQEEGYMRHYPDGKQVFAKEWEAEKAEKVFEPVWDLKDLFRPQNQNQAVYFAWQRFVSNYSTKQLTDRTDKLPAIGGLVRRVHDSAGDQYLAGLWRHDLIRQLCWIQTEKQQLAGSGFGINSSQEWDLKEKYRAPSWSWAALDLAVCYPKFENEEDSSQRFTSPLSPNILETSIEYKSSDEFGQVQTGSIKLRGRIITFQPAKRGDWGVFPLQTALFQNPLYQQEHLKRVRLYNSDGDPVGMLVLDRENWTLGVSPDLQSNMVIRCLRMWRFEEKSLHVIEDNDLGWECQLIGLALRPLSKPSTQYERIGIAYLQDQKGNQLFEDAGSEEELILV